MKIHINPAEVLARIWETDGKLHLRPIQETPVYKFALAGGDASHLHEYYRLRDGVASLEHDIEVAWKRILLDRIANLGYHPESYRDWPILGGRIVSDGQGRIGICAALGIESIEVEQTIQDKYPQWSQAIPVGDYWLDVTQPPDWGPRQERRATWGGASWPLIGFKVDFQGKSVLDLGCAEGFYCRKAIDAGAGRVVGFDRDETITLPGLPGQSVVEQAREVTWLTGYSDKPIEYIATDLREWKPDEQFDVVFAMKIAYHMLEGTSAFLAKASQAARESLVVQCNTGHTGRIADYASPDFNINTLQEFWKTIDVYTCGDAPIIICHDHREDRRTKKVTINDRREYALCAAGPAPLISVLLPTWNAGKYLARSVDSIVKQTVEDWELIIVDDGSTDKTHEYLFKLAQADSRIRIVLLPHVGLVTALNTGLRLCRGKYIARQDADDISLCHRFKAQLEFLEKRPDLDGCGSAFQEIDEKGVLGREIEIFSEDPVETRQTLLHHTSIPHPTYFFRRRVYERFQYDPAYHAEDLEFLFRATEVYKLACVPEILVLHRIHPEQKTPRKVARCGAQTTQKYAKLEEQGLWRSP